MNPLQLLQKKSGANPDGDFGKETFTKGKEYLAIPNDWCAIHFFAQVGHETGNFRLFEENLNYSEEALLRVFRKYFNEEQAKEYARQPERIANRVYANRMGNGDEQSGDGWKYRGRGALQLTGRFNYQQFSVKVNDHKVVTFPDIVATDYAFESAIHFFNVNGLWEICRLGLHESVIKKVTKRVNGYYNGLEHRIELTGKYA
jgi:putative chitinase